MFVIAGWFSHEVFFINSSGLLHAEGNKCWMTQKWAKITTQIDD